MACPRRALVFFLEKGERREMAFWTSLKELSSVSRERIGAKPGVDPETWKSKTLPLPAVLFIRRLSGGVAGRLTS